MGNITRLTQSQKKDAYFSSAFLSELENHIPILIKKGSFLVKVMDPNTALGYKGDFAGLLRHLLVPEQFIYPNVRLNGLISASDYDGKNVKIALLDQNVLVELFRLWTPKKQKS